MFLAREGNLGEVRLCLSVGSTIMRLGVKEKYAPERTCLPWGTREGYVLVAMDQEAVI